MLKIVTLSSLALSLVAPGLTYAQQGPGTPPADNPCEAVVKACRTAGFEGKDRWHCVEELKHGKEVKDSKGNVVTAEVSDACKAMHGHQHGAGHHGHGNKEGGAAPAPAAGG